MKTIPFFMMLLLAIQGLKAQTTHTVKQVGFTYDPATVTIQAGESVKFEGAANHPILEVSETTWTNKGITPLDGGFSFPDGSGTVNFPNPGTHFYVCTAHVASENMKGKIIVTQATALNEVPVSDKFSLYPVPLTGNELMVSLKSTDQHQIAVDIYDLAGNLRVSSLGNSMDGTLLVDCSYLPNGMFLLKMKSDGTASYGKFVKY